MYSNACIKCFKKIKTSFAIQNIFYQEGEVADFAQPSYGL
jgi:hypothetical protein